MQFLSQLKEEKGIWYSPNTDAISYPKEGNSLCYQLEDNSYWFAHRNTCLSFIINKYATEGVFADVGGGNGFVSAMLQESGHHVVLIEPGQTGCFNAKKRGIEKVACARLEDVDWSKSELKNAGIFDVLEHIEAHEVFLKTIHSALAENGKLFITVPSFQHLWSQEDVKAGHFRRYTKKSLSQVLSRAGFKMTYSSYMFSCLHLPIYVLRTLPTKLGLRRSDFKNDENEHGTEGGFMISMIKRLLKREQNNLMDGKTARFGSSLVVVAVKK
ncbi:class I SAM-dependent methyltransferase [Roseivirga sp.]|uniref:class I SAM-dependent methyltransferase n=1 Tax=Roseivirga sp. TaxID=1964215 RepID=UPI002B26BCF4|nr:class I SAM-dependent methyltransferase [Roseivirga sp.]